VSSYHAHLIDSSMNKIRISIEANGNAVVVNRTTVKTIAYLHSVIVDKNTFEQCVSAMKEDVRKMSENETVEIVIVAYPVNDESSIVVAAKDTSTSRMVAQDVAE